MQYTIEEIMPIRLAQVARLCSICSTLFVFIEVFVGRRFYACGNS